jgi:hypothetical protein
MRVAALVAVLLLGGCAFVVGPRRAAQPPPPPAPPGSPEVRAIRARTMIVVDGLDTDAAWREAPETVVPLDGDGGPRSCLLRAAVWEGTFFLLVRWEDPTESREPPGPLAMPRGVTPWTPWGDALRVDIPIEGRLIRALPDASAGTTDCWLWDAARTEPHGRALDGLCWPSGYPASAKHDRGAAPSGPGRPGGSAADVRARGTWADGGWTVEFARSLSTGNPDDRDLAGLAEVPMAVFAVRADSGWGDSPVLRLLLPPPAPGPVPEPLRGPGAGR